MPEDAMGVRISAREIYDEIVGMRNDIQRLTQENAGVTNTVADHESRIRSLEQLRWSLPLTAAAGVAGTIGAALFK